ncbi:MAG TPA: hypothetical protein ENF33_04225 [Nitrososphaeria archaeon]|nr:hypothetical protein [Nitrososphaeria archaeon]
MRIRILSELHDRRILEKVAEALKEIYGEDVVIEFVDRLFDETFLNPSRGQYDAWPIVQSYRSVRADDEYLLLITDKDLYAAGLNYVFGLAWHGIAIVSTHRLTQEFYGLEPDRELFVERLIKEAVHELGHLHGLTHCSDKRCVMAFSNWIGDTDYKSYRPCYKCRGRLKFLRTHEP